MIGVGTFFLSKTTRILDCYKSEGQGYWGGPIAEQSYKIHSTVNTRAALYGNENRKESPCSGYTTTSAANPIATTTSYDQAKLL